MVAAGNMTGPNLDTYHSSSISLRSICTIVFLSEMNDIKICTGDISNAYPTVRTYNKIFFNAGTEFAPFGHAGPLILIKTALYGLKSSGVRFHSRLSDALTAIGFVPSIGG